MSDKKEDINVLEIDKYMKTKSINGFIFKWHSPMNEPMRLSGFPWIKEDKVYRRMPLKPPKPLPENVFKLAHHTSGGQVSFATDSARLAIRVCLTGKSGMDHMALTGQCGFDCYISESGRNVFCSVTRFKYNNTIYESLLYNVKDSILRHVTINFPLYQGVKQVLIGLNDEAHLYPPKPYRLNQPIVFYGTSITQGGCASRPGMNYTNIISRKLNMECINFGFSGSGRGEPEVAQMVASIKEPACFVIDYEANAWPGNRLENTLVNFIKILRKTHRSVPVLVVSKIRYANENLISEKLERRLYYREFQRKIVEGFRNKGDKNIHFCDASGFFGDDFDECTVDGVHPTDLGFYRIAESLAPVIKKILNI
jgi:hypothetical protein